MYIYYIFFSSFLAFDCLSNSFFFIYSKNIKKFIPLLYTRFCYNYTYSIMLQTFYVICVENNHNYRNMNYFVP